MVDIELAKALKESAAEHFERKQKQEQTLQVIVNKIDPCMHIQAVIADGNCLFRALARTYNQQKHTMLTHSYVRDQCVLCIDTDQEFCDRFHTIAEKAQYLQHMCQDASYGDELCVHAFCATFQCQVAVFSPQWDTQIFGAKPADKLQLSLAYNGRDHYDAILFRRNIPIAERNDEQAAAAPDTTPIPVPPPSERDTITILSINVSSWLPHRDNLLGQSDIIAVQETRLTAAGQRNNQKYLHKHGYQAIHGAPCPPVTINKNGCKWQARASSASGRHGGVGIFTRQPWVAQRCVPSAELMQLAKVGRWTYGVVPLGSKGARAKGFLHLISFYNLAGRDQGVIRTNKYRYLEKVLSHATGLGDQPVLICMDANSSIQASHCLTLATNSGKWIDLGAHYTNNQPGPTFGASKDWDRVTWGPNVSRPDCLVTLHCCVFVKLSNFDEIFRLKDISD